MPLLLIPLLPLVLLAAWALLLPLSLWLRYRVGKSRQRAVGWIVAANAWALAVSTILFLLGAWIGGHWVVDALRDACLGLLAGIALGLWQGWEHWQAPASPSPALLAGQAGLFALGGLLLGHALAYAWGLRVRLRRRRHGFG